MATAKKATRTASVVEAVDLTSNPIHMRNRIIEIDHMTAMLAKERADLITQIEALGFTVRLGSVGAASWKPGDRVRCIRDGVNYFSKGGVYVISATEQLSDDTIRLQLRDRDGDLQWRHSNHFELVSRG